MVPVAFVVLSDELRPDAKETVERFAEGGIKLKILSGDNPDTVQALAEQAGFHPDTPLMSGIEFDKLPESEHARVVERGDDLRPHLAASQGADPRGAAVQGPLRRDDRRRR